MPSIHHQPSPYAEPNTPIASAKRPRTVLEQTSPDNEHDEDRGAVSELHRDGSKTGISTGNGSDGEGTWKGRVVSLFSPVLKFVGGAQEGREAKEEEYRLHEEFNVAERRGAAAVHDQENDLNWENRNGQPPPVAVKVGRGEKAALAEVEAAVCQQREDHQNDLMDVESTLENGDSSEVEVEEEREEEGEEDNDVAEEFNPFLFIKQLPPYEHVAIRGKVCLPQRKHTRSAPASIPVTLVLDLDETLVHCTVEPVPDPDVVFPVDFNGVSYQVHVRKRPHLEEFLRRVSKMFEVVVFTASQQVYADALLDLIDPGQKLIKHRLFRDACLPVEGNYIKDLHVLGRDMARTVLIDNSPYAYGYQLDNGIPIESWFEDRDDAELLKLLPFLEQLNKVDDVRPLIRTAFQSHLRVQES
eukprot:evm.model.NODE_4663_length_47357_cov_23.541208.10